MNVAIFRCKIRVKNIIIIINFSQGYSEKHAAVSEVVHSVINRWSVCHSLVLRMRSAVLLVLLVSLMFTDGLDECVRYRNDQCEKINNSPCLATLNNNAYAQFKRKHILSDVFDTNSLMDWSNYLIKQKLCGTDRPSQQSFVHNENSIINICNGGGIRFRDRNTNSYKDNLCTSRATFTVYIVTKIQQWKPCVVVDVKVIQSYVVVACDVVGNKCLPVHYQTQTDTPPDQNDETCQPPTYWHHEYIEVEEHSLYR